MIWTWIISNWKLVAGGAAVVSALLLLRSVVGVYEERAELRAANEQMIAAVELSEKENAKVAEALKTCSVDLADITATLAQARASSETLRIQLETDRAENAQATAELTRRLREAIANDQETRDWSKSDLPSAVIDSVQAAANRASNREGSD